MATSKTEIANMSLAHLGQTKFLTNIESDTGTLVAVINRFYDTARKATLRDFPWPFSTKFLSLGLVEEDPTSEWGFSYQYPSDCLKFRRILSGDRNDTHQSRVAYRQVYGDAGTLIYTDWENAEAEYTVDVEDVSRFPHDFVISVSLRLAAYIAPGVTNGDPFKLGQRALQLYALELGIAQKNILDEEQLDVEPDSEFVRIRG